MEQKNSYWKFVGVFLGIIVLGLAGFIASRIYGLRLEKQASDAALEALRKTADENYQKALTDTYGGKTPQETLALYIDAVEKGDYVLASRYFVVEGQGEELKSFNGTTKEKVNNYVALLKEALGAAGVYALNNTYFSINRPISIEMNLYPSGIWKIIEI